MVEIEKREDLWYNKISINRDLVKTKMIINIDYDLKGSILDIGGGGEAIIGQMYGDIRLAEVSEGAYFLNAAPLNLSGADGSPCRAVLIADER